MQNTIYLIAELSEKYSGDVRSKAGHTSRQNTSISLLILTRSHVCYSQICTFTFS